MTGAAGIVTMIEYSHAAALGTGVGMTATEGGVGAGAEAETVDVITAVAEIKLATGAVVGAEVGKETRVAREIAVTTAEAEQPSQGFARETT